MIREKSVRALAMVRGGAQRKNSGLRLMRANPSRKDEWAAIGEQMVGNPSLITIGEGLPVT